MKLPTNKILIKPIRNERTSSGLWLPTTRDNTSERASRKGTVLGVPKLVYVDKIINCPLLIGDTVWFNFRDALEALGELNIPARQRQNITKIKDDEIVLRYYSLHAVMKDTILYGLNGYYLIEGKGEVLSNVLWTPEKKINQGIVRGVPLDRDPICEIGDNVGFKFLGSQRDRKTEPVWLPLETKSCLTLPWFVYLLKEEQLLAVL